MVTYLLVPSPLLGPATWAPVATRLHAGGHGVVIASVDDVVPVAANLGTVVLVPHSNAGYRASYLAEQLGTVPTVYVDAALPPADASETTLAPAAFLEFLAGLADADGILPPWTQWWDDLGEVFPDEETRRAVEAEEPRLPLDYFRQRVPVAVGWARKPCAYVAFGQTYAEEIAFAQEQDWPVHILDGEHLHQLHDPDAVASAILEAASLLGV
ncbi:alpha/beta hydrolase [Nocardioides marmorisolisilvae]|uniref:Alpha/beta hydrolase n=1 Tax=Nocardioides marmorisolisilvae TaxID=1542737 RepID=A0A3N0DTU8_9ACTN|nr:alpha/beta hydrolase [Nocardioides marmorisolisilvae]RNL78926.1 alpha/beta hydrolase [Nocardioides marmorisolisilvae]